MSPVSSVHPSVRCRLAGLESTDSKPASVDLRSWSLRGDLSGGYGTPDGIVALHRHGLLTLSRTGTIQRQYRRRDPLIGPPLPMEDGILAANRESGIVAFTGSGNPGTLVPKIGAPLAITGGLALGVYAFFRTRNRR